MQLPHGDLELFRRLHLALLSFVNQRLRLVDDKIASPKEPGDLPSEERFKIQDALCDNLDLIDAFVAENPVRLSEDELDIVRSWRHLVAGKFYVFRELKKHAVFLSTTSPVVAYGVQALSQPFAVLIGTRLPVLVKTVLLPFKGVIVYDGLMVGYNIVFGPGIRRNLNEDYKEAKARQGIVTSLPMSTAPLPPKSPQRKKTPKPTTKKEADNSLDVVIGLIDDFCEKHLNEEYAVLCRKLAEKLSRKRPSPLRSGNPNAWASGIIRAVGGVNFLHDKSQTPYMRSTDIDRHLGISPSTGAAKLAAIRKAVKMLRFDPEWILPSRLDDFPMAWTIMINGVPLDVRDAPRDVQEIAFKKGLIPYIPADRR